MTGPGARGKRGVIWTWRLNGGNQEMRRALVRQTGKRLTGWNGLSRRVIAMLVCRGLPATTTVVMLMGCKWNK